MLECADLINFGLCIAIVFSTVFWFERALPIYRKGYAYRVLFDSENLIIKDH